MVVHKIWNRLSMHKNMYLVTTQLTLKSCTYVNKFQVFMDNQPYSRAQPTCASWWETVWWSRSNFLGLLPKSGKDQWDCKISNYYVALPLQISSSPFKYPYLFWVGWPQNVLIVARLHCRKSVCNSPRNLTGFPRPFLLVRGCGLGMRLNLPEPQYPRLQLTSCVAC